MPHTHMACRHPEVTNLAKSQCNSKVEVGGTVDMVLLEGGFLFVGLHVGKEGDGLIKVWNTATGAEQSLSGPKVGFWGCAGNPRIGKHACGPCRPHCAEGLSRVQSHFSRMQALLCQPTSACYSM